MKIGAIRFRIVKVKIPTEYLVFKISDRLKIIFRQILLIINIFKISHCVLLWEEIRCINPVAFIRRHQTEEDWSFRAFLHSKTSFRTILNIPITEVKKQSIVCME